MPAIHGVHGKFERKHFDIITDSKDILSRLFTYVSGNNRLGIKLSNFKSSICIKNLPNPLRNPIYILPNLIVRTLQHFLGGTNHVGDL